jgi:hypothetical protein
MLEHPEDYKPAETSKTDWGKMLRGHKARTLSALEAMRKLSGLQQALKALHDSDETTS